MLNVNIHVGKKVDSSFLSGVIFGLESYLSENKVRYSIKVKDEFKDTVNGKAGHVLARASAHNLLKQIEGQSNIWNWAIIKKEMFCPEDRNSYSTLGYFNSPEPFRPDINACIISQYEFRRKDKKHKYAQGALLGYHEPSAHNRSGDANHCRSNNCVNSEYDIEGKVLEHLLEKNEILKCGICKRRHPYKFA